MSILETLAAIAIFMAIVLYLEDLRRYNLVLRLSAAGLAIVAGFLISFPQWTGTDFTPAPKRVVEVAPEVQSASKVQDRPGVLSKTEQDRIEPSGTPDANIELPGSNETPGRKIIFDSIIGGSSTHTVAYDRQKLFGAFATDSTYSSEVNELMNAVESKFWNEAEQKSHLLSAKLSQLDSDEAKLIEGQALYLHGVSQLEQNYAKLAVVSLSIAIEHMRKNHASPLAIIRAGIDRASADFAAGGSNISVPGNPMALLNSHRSDNLQEIALLYRVRALEALVNGKKELARTYLDEAKQASEALSAKDTARSEMLLTLMEKIEIR